MKQFFLVLSFFFTLLLTTSASSSPAADPAVEKAFNKLFAGASHVSWSKEDGNYLRASFIWGDHHTLAYFDTNARLVGSIRGMFFSQLPLAVVRSFNSSFENHVVLEVREIFNEESINYSLLTECKNKKYRIRLN